MKLVLLYFKVLVLDADTAKDEQDENDNIGISIILAIFANLSLCDN